VISLTREGEGRGNPLSRDESWFFQ
jgi:hypothetical protein